VVGKKPFQKRFMVYSSVMIQRSEFFRAARSPQWLADPTKPVDLEDYDADIFEAYLNCAYFGARIIKSKVEDEAPPAETSFRYNHAYQKPWLQQRDTPVVSWDDDVVDDDAGDNAAEPVEPDEPKDPEDAFTWSQQECERRCVEGHEQPTPYDHACSDHLLYLAKIWVQADSLQDLVTANDVMDEFTRFSYSKGYIPDDDVINLVYESTVHGSPLRKLMRDFYLYSTRSSYYLLPHLASLPAEFYRDIFFEYLRVKEKEPNTQYFQRGLGDTCFVSVREKTLDDGCRYHVHDSRQTREACGSPRYEMFDELRLYDD
jgi:hypothetical protein